MAKKPQLKKPLPLQRVREDVELEAGIYDTPVTILEDGGYHPEILLWVIVDGPILGSEMAKKGELLPQAGRLLRDSLKTLPFLPGKVRVASEELAKALRPEISTRIELVCAPTPHLDEVAEELRSHMTRTDTTFLARGADPAKVASFCRSAAKLYRAQPWRHLDADEGLIGVTIAEAEMHNSLLTVMGSGGESFGWLLCAGLDALDDFFAANEAAADSVPGADGPEWPHFLALNFDHKSDLAPTLARELAQHGWEIAGPQAYPWLMTTDEHQNLLGPAPGDLLIAEAICLAVPQLVAKPKALRDALKGKTPPLVLQQRVEVSTGRKIDITLTFPYEEEDVELLRPEHPILAALFDLEDEEEIDDEKRKELEDQLFAQFLASEQGKDFDRLDSVRLILDLLVSDFEITVPSIDVEVLTYVFGSLLPNQVDVDEEGAAEIVRECRAFFHFLAEACAHEPAADCADWLESKGALDLLRSALAQPNRFQSPPPSLGHASEAPLAPPTPMPAVAHASEESDDIKPRNPSPAERNKTKHAGPATGSSRRRR